MKNNERSKTSSNLPLIEPSSPCQPSIKSIELWTRAYKKVRMNIRIKRLLATVYNELYVYYDDELKRYVLRKRIYFRIRKKKKFIFTREYWKINQ